MLINGPHLPGENNEVFQELAGRDHTERIYCIPRVADIRNSRPIEEGKPGGHWLRSRKNEKKTCH